MIAKHGNFNEIPNTSIFKIALFKTFVFYEGKIVRHQTFFPWLHGYKTNNDVGKSKSMMLFFCNFPDCHMHNV